MAREVKILDTRPILSADAARVGKQDYVVTYQVDGARVGFVILPKEAPTQPEIQAAIAAQEKSRAGTVGQTFTLP